MATTNQVLKFIKDNDGATLTQIQAHICSINGLDFTAKDVNGDRRYRGYWTNRLYGGQYFGPGILNTYCEKIDGKWKVKPSVDIAAVPSRPAVSVAARTKARVSTPVQIIRTNAQAIEAFKSIIMATRPMSIKVS